MKSARIAERGLALAWALFRTLALLAAIYPFRAQILTWIEHRFELNYVTVFAIGILSAPLTRLAVALAVGASLVLLVLATRRLRPGWRFLARAAGILAIVAASHFILDLRTRFGMALAILLMTNLTPDQLIDRSPAVRRLVDGAVKWVPALGEAFLTRRYLTWVAQLWPGRTSAGAIPWGPVEEALPGILIGAVALALCANSPHSGPYLDAPSFTAFEQRLRLSPEVTIFAKGDFNGLALSQDGRFLYATGHGAPRLLRFSTADVKAPPLAADRPNGGAQSLHYAPDRNEVAVVEDGRIQVLDAATLHEVRVFDHGADIAEGDAWLEQEPTTGTLLVASEADGDVGAPILVLDRMTGAERARLDAPAGNTLLHPTKPIIYLSFFRKGDGVVAYDLRTFRTGAAFHTPERLDRMVYDPDANEILVTEPTASRIARLDADTLAEKGGFPAMFGVRTLAIDPVRKLIMVGSLATGKIELMDLRTGARIRSWYLGPWLRSIVLDPASGTAFVSSNGFLFKLPYARR